MSADTQNIRIIGKWGRRIQWLCQNSYRSSEIAVYAPLMRSTDLAKNSPERLGGIVRPSSCNASQLPRFLVKYYVLRSPSLSLQVVVHLFCSVCFYSSFYTRHVIYRWWWWLQLHQVITSFSAVWLFYLSISSFVWQRRTCH